MIRETTLQINLNNLRDNICYLRSLTKKGTLFMAVVKANSYGNNSVEIAKFLQRQKLADAFAVAFGGEGCELRKNGIELPILVLHPLAGHFKKIIKHKLTPTIYSTRCLDRFLEVAKEKKVEKYPIHLACNTGMNRIGFKVEEIEQVCRRLAEEKRVKITGAYSHLLASEDPEAKEFMQRQIELFLKAKETIEREVPNKVLFHLCNTSAIINYPEAHLDMVRSGIGMYGFANDAKLQENFKPITTLKSVISQINVVEEGEYVGYNFGFKAEKRTVSATIPVGHADGLNRIYGKGAGFVFVAGEKAPILGNVCMDTMMVDVTGIDCKEGDEVVVFDASHTSEALAESAKTISYELLTSMSRRIKRKYIFEKEK